MQYAIFRQFWRSFDRTTIGFLELIVGHIIFESRKECNDVEGNEGY